MSKRCQHVIPGIGQCVITGNHSHDSHGREIHKRGEVTWNGDIEKFIMEGTPLVSD